MNNLDNNKLITGQGAKLNPWPVISSKVIGDFKIFTLKATCKRSPRTGVESTYYALETLDWVNVVAITPDNCMVLVEQYRHATNTLELELPGGMMNPDEKDPIAAGCRELREETGYGGDEPCIIGSCFANPAILTNRSHTILVKNCREKYPLEWDSGEDIRIQLIPVTDVFDLVAAGKIRHSVILAALFYYKLFASHFN